MVVYADLRKVVNSEQTLNVYLRKPTYILYIYNHVEYNMYRKLCEGDTITFIKLNEFISFLHNI